MLRERRGQRTTLGAYVWRNEEYERQGSSDRCRA